METFEQFESAARSQGFDVVLERRQEAGTVVASHMHPFDVHARLVQGEMWLSVGGGTRHLRPGDTFELRRQTSHAERYGPEGATYWVARRGPGV
jgi:quercetin dioxygenase-like cupin family protein